MSGSGVNEVLYRRRFLRQNPHAATFGKEIKSPLQQHKQPIGKSNEEVNMYACPKQPSSETRKTANRKSATAYVRPTIARSPLSQYQKGFGCARPATRRRITSATYLPSCIAG